MIGDLNETIKQLLVEGVPLDLSEIDVVFEKPDSEWSSSLSRPTINCYLYYVAENLELRQTNWQIAQSMAREEAARTRSGNGNGNGNGGNATGDMRTAARHTVIKKRPPFRMNLHYMVTAWANEVEDEHRLLWRVLAALIRFNNGDLPQEKLQGQLGEQDWPVPVMVAQQESPIKNPTDFWSSMEVAIKPSVNLMLTVPLDPDMDATVPLVLTRIIRVYNEEASEENRVDLPALQFGGWVWSSDAPDAKPVEGAEVLIVERGTQVVSDVDGRFKFDHVPHGRYTLRATADGGRAERQIVLPGEGYDLQLGSATGTKSSRAPEEPDSSKPRQDGKGRRR